MTEHDGAENAELDAQPESDEETGGINEEHAEELASADYQERIQEFDNVESSVPVTTVPETGESGKVEMPKS